MVIEKDSLRARFKKELISLSKQEKRQQSDKMVNKLREFFVNQDGCWTIFSPLNDEPNLLNLIQATPHITWVFPKIENKEHIQFYKVTSTEEMLTNLFGLDEPKGDESDRVERADITGCMVPGLAFDRFGTRLGRGGGYYDRYLENFKGRKLGVTFNEGLSSEALPRKSHDQIMNIVISPDAWIEVDTSEVNNGF